MNINDVQLYKDTLSTENIDMNFINTNEIDDLNDDLDTDIQNTKKENSIETDNKILDNKTILKQN